VLLTSLALGQSELSLDEKSARRLIEKMRVDGKAGSAFDFRVTSTDRAYNYKLRATWLTPEVIRASARLAQLREGLDAERTAALVDEAMGVGDTVILIEIDPREGSGIIPGNWTATLVPERQESADTNGVKGVLKESIRSLKALAGVGARDYAYDAFWVVFPLKLPSGEPLFRPSDRTARLAVYIHNKGGRVAWPIPASILNRANAVSQP